METQPTNFRLEHRNPLLLVDSYKASHSVLYPPGTSSMYSYAESRGSTRGWPETMVFGLQYFLRKYLTQKITTEHVTEAAAFFKLHGEPFPAAGFQYIVDRLEGKWPVRIRSVKEGTLIPNHNLLMDIESTDEKVFWVATWLETALLRALWYPSTVATQSFYIKKTILDFMTNTADDVAGVDFMLHDFGARGVSSHESAGIGGAAHLVNFQGSDTIEAILLLREYYGAEMAAFSVPATEHSNMTAWGRAFEQDAYQHALGEFADYPIISVVSDSWDIFNAIDNIWGGELYEAVLARADQGKLTVIRFDSGAPISTIILEGLQRLEKAFGTKLNAKGYKLLNGVRVLQGDGINRDSIYEILATITNAGYSAANIGTFGMGGALLQGITRDTQKFAFKCSSVIISGVRRDVWKEPVTDPGKISKRGRLDLVHRQGRYQTVEFGAPDTAMRVVYENGKVLVDDTLDQIRARANNALIHQVRHHV